MMKQSYKKQCPKGGQHQNRNIQAICLQQQCHQNRLLCFYCIHKEHQNHQVVYLLQGLSSPIEKLNVNSKVANKQVHQKQMQRKIARINYGWKSLCRMFEGYIRRIQGSIEPQVQVIRESFHSNSVRKLVDAITDVNTTPEMLDKYLDKIRLVMRYDLGNINKLKLSTDIAYQELRVIYKQANDQISSIMKKIVDNTNIFASLNQTIPFMERVDRNDKKLQIDHSNRITISINKDNTYVKGFDQSKLTIQKRIQNRFLQKKLQIMSDIPPSNQINKHREIEAKQPQQKGKICNHDSNVPRNSHKCDEPNNLMQQQHCRQGFGQIVHQSDIWLNYSQSVVDCYLADDDNHYHDQRQGHSLQSNQHHHHSQPLFKEVTSNALIYNQSLSELPQSTHHVHPQQVQSGQILHHQTNKSHFGHLFNIPDEIKRQHSNQQALISQISSSQQSEQNQEPFFIKYRNFQFQQSESDREQISPLTIYLKQIYINSPKLKEIQEHLLKIKPQVYNEIESLQICCETLPTAVNQSIIEIITRFRNLKQLSICQANGMRKQHLTAIIQCLPQLQHLVLEQFYSLDLQLAQLIIKKLRKLKRFHYTSDSLKNLRFKQDNTQFMVQVDGCTQLPVISKLAQLPSLQTISFESISRLNQIRNNLCKLNKISQLVIVSHQKQLKANPLLQHLLSLTTSKDITHIQLKQCSFKESTFIKLIQTCQGLKSMMLNKCQNIGDLTIHSLKRHQKYLRQLDLMQQDQITGDGFQNLTQLQNLGIKACWQIKQQLFGVNIRRLGKLRYLNLNLNRYWLTQAIFDHLLHLYNLQVLHIDNNKLGLPCLLKISTLTNLITLVVGNTELTGHDVLMFLSSTSSKIRKLSLKRQVFSEKSSKNQINNQPFQGNLLSQISQKTQHLTHLNIKGMKNVKQQHFQNLKNLQCLSTDIGQLDQQTLNYLKNRQISLYIGYAFHNYQQGDENVSLSLQNEDSQIVDLYLQNSRVKFEG